MIVAKKLIWGVYRFERVVFIIGFTDRLNLNI